MPKRIDPGKLRHLVSWVKDGPGPLNSSRQPTTIPVTLATFRAAVEPIRGTEAFAAPQVQANTTYRVTMWNVGPIGPGDRLNFVTGGVEKVLNVVSVLPPLDPSDPYMVIMAEERNK